MKNTDELKNKIIKWLNEQGYPLEMRISASLQQKGFRVVQSEYFIDPESGDYREIDVVALVQKEIDDVLFRVTLLIECKLSTDKPWLLFTSKETRLANPACVAQRAANSLGTRYLYEICNNDHVQKLSIFSLPERPAYGVTQALTQGKDVCYSAATSVSKATFSTVAELDEKRRQQDENICSIILPVVVIEGQLFEVFLENRSDVVVNNIDNGTLLWRNPVLGMPHTILNIVTATAFDRFADEVLASTCRLFELSEKELLESLRKVLEEENKPSCMTF